MNSSIMLLSATAISIGFLHTILGPDHYLPFIVLSEAKKWNIRKTMLITFLCGIGHVLSSVILGFIGIGVGIELKKLTAIESVRGKIAAWLIIAFGLVYMVISARNVVKGKKHSHSHHHLAGIEHTHEHDHHYEHTHVHESVTFNTTPWILFLIFIFGPCEPLILLVMYPAAQNNIPGVIVVATLFSIITISTMVAIVVIFKLGLSRVNLKPVEKYSNLLAGSMIFLTGLAIIFLGL